MFPMGHLNGEMLYESLLRIYVDVCSVRPSHKPFALFARSGRRLINVACIGCGAVLH